MKNDNHRQYNLVMVVSVMFLAVSASAFWGLWLSPTRAATPEPDRIATGVAEGKAVAATLTADAPVIDRIATGVAEAKAVAATLTADAPVIDRIATGVAEAKAIAATLTAEGPSPVQTCVPEKIPTATITVSAEQASGATRHCPAKAGYSTIELRNIVANVKSLNFFVDGVQVTTVPYGKYDCIYLENGKYVFQWKNDSKQKQSNARSFTVNGPDAWYSGSKRPDGIRNPYDAWLDVFKPTKTPTPLPTDTPTTTP